MGGNCRVRGGHTTLAQPRTAGDLQPRAADATPAELPRLAVEVRNLQRRVGQASRHPHQCRDQYSGAPASTKRHQKPPSRNHQPPPRYPGFVPGIKPPSPRRFCVGLDGTFIPIEPRRLQKGPTHGRTFFQCCASVTCCRFAVGGWFESHRYLHTTSIVDFVSVTRKILAYFGRGIVRLWWGDPARHGCKLVRLVPIFSA